MSEANETDNSAPVQSIVIHRFRAGDTVKHGPTGETWILAVDQFGNDVSPCGWPETIAKAADCEIVKRASDSERHSQLLRSSKLREPHDIRRREARHQLSIGG